MGLRDRLRLLVRPGAAAPAPRTPAPLVSAPPAPGPRPVVIPQRAGVVPAGARRVHVGGGDPREGAECLPPAVWPTLRGRVVFESNDGGIAASAAAERAASFGHAEVSWRSVESA